MDLRNEVDEITDAFIRYVLPKMLTKVEGRGNLTRTNVVSMNDVARALKRPASYITKYFAYELGAKGKYDNLTGKAFVSGVHDTTELVGLLASFIKLYVQCYWCTNHGTKLFVTKTQKLRLKCGECGSVSNVDMRNKLASFILKDKKMRRNAVSNVGYTSPGDRADENHSAGDGYEVQEHTDASLRAVSGLNQELLNDITAEMVTLSIAEPDIEKANPVEAVEAVVKNGSTEQPENEFDSDSELVTKEE